jgi:single-stranded-DNA-specific exonuclease
MNHIDIVLKSEKIIDKNCQDLDFLEILLNNRGISKDNLHEFLNPPFPKELKPENFGVDSNNLKTAKNRIQKAINDDENILIYGDYDVDGITSTAVLWQTLHALTKKVMPFVPDRENDGYGIKAASYFNFEKEKNTKFSLLITVDNGIVATEEIKKIVKEGTEVIVVDHHIPTETLPPACAFVHSTLVSGCTLAWLLAFQFNKDADLGLAALGAVADCMPLNGVNRSIVVHGLQSLRLNPGPGIKKLIQVSGSKQDGLSAYDLGFVLGPRINAVGRLSNPTDALRLLCSSSTEQAAKFAQVLDSYNKDRQTLQQDSLEIAQSAVADIQDKLIFVADQSYHPGIIGLIAGKLTEKYYLPSIAISVGEEVSKGSCRSIKELNIVESLREHSDLLVELGGHAGAAGFSVKTENIEKFKAAITKTINEKLNGLDLKPSVTVDAVMKLSAATIKIYRIINKLEPFGLENPEPLFLFKNLAVVQKRVVGGRGEHLKLKLDDPETRKIENISADAIAFKKGEMDGQLKIGSRVDVIARLGSNTWNGITLPQLIVKEIFLV